MGQTKISSENLGIKYFIGLSAYLGILNYFGSDLFFRDFAIIFEGTREVSNGLRQYKDFGLPVGPVTLWITYYFNIAFGSDWHGLKLTQLLFTNLTGLICWFLINESSASKNYKFASLIILGIGYLTLLSYPWYNNLAAFFLILTVYLSSRGTYLSSFLAGITIGLAALTKIDFGLLSLLSALAVIVPFSKFSFALKGISSLCLGLLVVFTLNYDLILSDEFLYWTLNDELETADRINKLLRKESIALITLASFFYVHAVLKNKQEFLHYSVLNISAAVTLNTSGLDFTSYYSLFTLPLIATQLGYKNIFLISTILLSLKPIYQGLHKIKNTLLKEPTPYYFSLTKVDRKSSHLNLPKPINLGECIRSYEDIYGPPDFCKLYSDLEALESESFLNATEFLELNRFTKNLAKPYKPLWLHHNVSTFSKEEMEITQGIMSGKFDVIANQAAHGPHIYHLIKSAIEKSKHYQLKATYFSSKNYTDCPDNEKSCRIHVYLRKKDF